jgi:integrase
LQVRVLPGAPPPPAHLRLSALGTRGFCQPPVNAVPRGHARRLHPAAGQRLAGHRPRRPRPSHRHLPLRRLDPATLDRFCTELRGRGGVGGRPMAPATVRQVHAILRRALDQAARWGWIPANPAALATPPRLGSAEIRPPTRRYPGCLRPPTRLTRTLRSCCGCDDECSARGVVRAAVGERRPEGGRAPDPAQPVPGRGPPSGEGHQDPRRPPAGPLRRERGAPGRAPAPLRRAGGGLRRAALRRRLCVLLRPGWPAAHAPGLGDAPVLRLAERLGLRTRLHDLRHYAATQLIAGGVDLRTVSGRIGHAVGERPRSGSNTHFLAAATDRQPRFSRGRSDAPRRNSFGS